MATAAAPEDAGFPVAASRPDVLMVIPWQWGVWGGLVLLVAVLACSGAGVDPDMSVPWTSSAVGIITASITWSHRRRAADVQQVRTAVAEVVTAWNGLKAATGITAAVEDDLPLIDTAKSRRRTHEPTRRNLEQSLRPTGRPR